MWALLLLLIAAPVQMLAQPTEAVRKRFEEIKAKAEKGEAEGQCLLGVCYYFGDGVAQDFTMAVKWYRKAAEQGHAGAQSNLGVCYHEGNGVTKDKRRS